MSNSGPASTVTQNTVQLQGILDSSGKVTSVMSPNGATVALGGGGGGSANASAVTDEALSAGALVYIKSNGNLANANAAVLTKPPARPLKGLFFGDSIPEGVRTVNATATNDTDRNDAGQSWTLEVGRILGAEVGNIGFGRQGFSITGNLDVPVFGTTYNQIYNGVSRTFPAGLDFVVIAHGTNDGSTNTVTAATGVLNGLITTLPSTTKIIVLRPFNGTAQAANLTAAIAACSAPSRCTYVDTAGFFNSANSADALHPYGVEHITHIAPLMASAISAIIGTVSTPISNSLYFGTGRIRRSATGATITGAARLRLG